MSTRFHFAYSESKFYCNNTCIGGALYTSCTLCPPLKFFPDFVSCDCECSPSTNLWTYQPGPQHWVLLKAFILAWSCYWLGPKPNVWLVWWSKCEKHGIEINIKFIGSRLVLPQVPSPYQRWYLHTYRGHLGWYGLRSYQHTSLIKSLQPVLTKVFFYKKYFQFFWFLYFGEFFFKILAILFFFSNFTIKKKIPIFLGHHSAQICPKREFFCW
jgi:hypothetical protein